MLVVLEPPTLQFPNADRLEAQGCWRTRFELSIDLGSQLPRRVAIAADLWSMPVAVLRTAQVPE